MSEQNLLNTKHTIDQLHHQVHVWLCSPSDIVDSEDTDRYLSILSDAERAQQQRFLFEKDQHSYLVSHALVRTVLSGYCDVPPLQWRFESAQHGKPEISSSMECPSLRFNLSHADGLTACAVTLGCECGVDVENIKRQSNLDAIAKRMFAQQELDVLHAVDDVAKREKFFEYWTLREAYVKALGTGLGGSSKQFYFDVSTCTDNTAMAEICFTSQHSGAAQDWQFDLIRRQDEHVVAVAVARGDSARKQVVTRMIKP